ncbi:zinc finger protein 862-like [Dreissena polymorpha]|uniref:zinc finger protein 862-like n=1 Tax=Dreissena polymorpha TaxID=45954 RepID=UPI0022651C17|nr:zinc finger protein 862-like [Dreissena polymorpha]
MEIPSSTINSLLDLQTKNGLNIKYTNLSPDTVSEIQTSIEHVLREGLVNDIKSSPVFAMMLDESTDLTVDKRLSICVRYIKAGEPVTNMLVNVHLEDGTAHTIMNCVAHEFERHGIDLANCTSLATDGAAVMLGKHKGVGQQLVSKYSPFCIQTHCMAHRLNLACTDSIKKNDFMIKFREKFSSLYSFISGSSNRTLALKKIQEILKEPEIKIKEPYSISWLGLKNAVSAVFESFGSVLATLSKFAAEKNSVAKGLLKYFSSYKVALAIAFILDVHNELAVLSCELQKKNLLFSEIKPVMDATVSKLSSLEATDGKCLTSMKTDIEITDDGAFFSGEKLKYHDNMGSEFATVRKDYIKRMKKNISDRFRKTDSDHYNDFCTLFEPQQINISTQEECNEALESLSTFYGYEKTVKVIDGNLIEGLQETVRVVQPLVDPAKVQEEWPRFQGMVKGAYADMPTNKRVILLHNDIIPNIAKLAAIALCLQPTSVECERTFSTQNRLKCKQRASLGNEALNTLMTICMLGPDISKYDPSPAVIYWLRHKRRRKPRLQSAYKPRAKKQKTC